MFSRTRSRFRFTRVRSTCWGPSAGGSGGAAGAGGDAVLGEDGLELLQRGVCSDPRRVKVGPADPEPGLRQVLQELVQPEETGGGSQRVLRWSQNPFGLTWACSCRGCCGGGCCSRRVDDPETPPPSASSPASQNPLQTSSSLQKKKS